MRARNRGHSTREQLLTPGASGHPETHIIATTSTFSGGTHPSFLTSIRKSQQIELNAWPTTRTQSALTARSCFEESKVAAQVCKESIHVFLNKGRFQGISVASDSSRTSSVAVQWDLKLNRFCAFTIQQYKQLFKRGHRRIVSPVMRCATPATHLTTIGSVPL